MISEKDIQDIKRRAGITEQGQSGQIETEIGRQAMMRMEQELADNYINGNISDVKQTLHGLDPAMAAAMAIRVYLYLNDVNPQHAGGFAKTVISAAR